MKTSIAEYIRTLAEQSFWGTLTLKFQAGQVIHLLKEESLKPDQLPGHRRNNDDLSR